MKVVSADSSCSVVWCGARVACADMSTGSVRASKARLGLSKYMDEYIFFHMRLPGAAPYGTRNGGLPICIWGWGLCSNGHGRDTTRITIQLAFWQLSDNVILIMFGTS
jgi:hypothetical protein